MKKNQTIVCTQYRDIPWEEVAKCLTPEGRKIQVSGKKAWEEKARGMPVQIITPPYEEPQWRFLCCGGPFYRVVGLGGLVCPHIAEIGD